LLSLLDLGTALPWSAELLGLARLPLTTLLAALTTLLAALLPSRSSRTARSLVGRLGALLGLLSAGLAFVLLLALVLVLGVFALRDDQAAVYSADAVKCDA